MNLRPISVLLVAFGLLMTVGASVAQTAQYVQVQNNTGQVILTRWALQHIMARHWPDSLATGGWIPNRVLAAQSDALAIIVAAGLVEEKRRSA